MEIKEQLLTTAIDLFKKDGYQNVTVQSICDACHVTKGSFYYHYRYKESLLMDYYHIVAGEELTDVLTEMLRIPDGFHKLWRLFRFYIDSSTRLGADLLKNLMKVNLDNNGIIYPTYKEEIEKVDPNFFKVYHSIVLEGQESGSIKKSDADEMLTLYMSVFVGALSSWSATGGYTDVEGLLFQVFTLIYKA